MFCFAFVSFDSLAISNSIISNSTSTEVKKADKKGEGGKEGEGRRWRKQKREVKVTRRDEGRW